MDSSEDGADAFDCTIRYLAEYAVQRELNPNCYLKSSSEYCIFDLNGKCYLFLYIIGDTNMRTLIPFSRTSLIDQFILRKPSGSKIWSALKFLGGVFAAGAAAQSGGRMMSKSYSSPRNNNSHPENSKWSRVKFNDGNTGMVHGEVVRTTPNSVIVKSGLSNIEWDSRGHATFQSQNEIDLRDKGR